MLSDFWNIGHHAVVSSSAQLLSKKSWQAVRACGLARTYSTKEMADAGGIDFQAAGVNSVWQGHTPERSFHGRISGKSHSARLIFGARPW